MSSHCRRPLSGAFADTDLLRTVLRVFLESYTCRALFIHSHASRRREVKLLHPSMRFNIFSASKNGAFRRGTREMAEEEARRSWIKTG